MAGNRRRIAVNGAALRLPPYPLRGLLCFEVMAKRTKYEHRFLNSGETVNLERSLKVGDKVSGHLSVVMWIVLIDTR